MTQYNRRSILAAGGAAIGIKLTPKIVGASDSEEIINWKHDVGKLLAESSAFVEKAYGTISVSNPESEQFLFVNVESDMSSNTDNIPDIDSFVLKIGDKKYRALKSLEGVRSNQVAIANGLKKAYAKERQLRWEDGRTKTIPDGNGTLIFKIPNSISEDKISLSIRPNGSESEVASWQISGDLAKQIRQTPSFQISEFEPPTRMDPELGGTGSITVTNTGERDAVFRAVTGNTESQHTLPVSINVPEGQSVTEKIFFDATRGKPPVSVGMSSTQSIGLSISTGRSEIRKSVPQTRAD
ncbi:hypothetical protein [Haloprofundus halobius]|uniref:hypothetical protein n=1 Tax=Haloprofundus halobius TaxID=2876194 RepID=UPI001CCDA02A|nr:hypothetical protein [Haloprofundus halobius]